MRVGFGSLLACLGQALVHGLPQCNYTHCPICLDPSEGTLNRSDLTFVVNGREYSAPLRIARCNSYWATHMMLGQALGILAQERLGLNVEYVNCEDEIHCHLAILGCVDWLDWGCTMVTNPSDIADAVANNLKIYNDPVPDIMVDLESWPEAQVEDSMGTSIDWASRPSTVVGSTGWIVRNGMFLHPNTFKKAWKESHIALNTYLAYTTDAAVRYLVSPSFYMRLGVQPEWTGCPGSYAEQAGEAIVSGMDNLADLGFTCNNSWWRTPACAALGDDWMDGCVAVLDDDWGYPKPDLYQSMKNSDMRVALLILGYDTFYEVALDSGITNTTFLSWSTDTTFAQQKPVRVALDEVEDLLISKLAWTKVLKVNEKLNVLLQQLSVDNDDITKMLDVNNRAVDAGYGPIEIDAPGFGQKVTCDWMRAHEAVWASWLPGPQTCMRGEVFVQAEMSCRQCPEGSHWVDRSVSQPQPVCKTCPAGSFAAESGRVECTLCPAGFYQPHEGTISCVACEQGRYQESRGESSCIACPDSFTTPFSGTLSASACTCPRGTYATRGRGCVPCHSQLDCLEGASRPQQRAGFWAEAVDPQEPSYTIWRCRSKEECPAGPAEGCARGREGRACHKCKDGHHASDDGECSECTEGALALPFVVMGVVAAMCILGSFFGSRRITSTQKLSQLTIFMTANQLIAAMQAFSSFKTFKAGYASPVVTFLDVMQATVFDLKRFQIMCAFGTSSPVAVMLVKLLAFPVGVLLVCLGALLTRCTNKPASGHVLFNMIGTILFTIYVGICLAMLLPLQCSSNPSPNTASTMVSSPGIVCWSSSDHHVLVALSIIGFLLYPVTLLTVVLWATLTYPAQVAAGMGLKLNVKYRFLFGKFRTERYYYGCIFLLRNFTLALIPVVFSDTGVLKLVIMAAVVVINMSLSGILWPWRTPGANTADQLLNACLIIAILAAAPLMENPDSVALNVLIFSMMVIMLLVGLLIISKAVYITLLSPKLYGIFLCHHKSASGVLCRYIKMTVEKQSTCHVFIDTDSVAGMEVLFDIVHCFVRNVVVVLTPLILNKTWCAGEIVTAYIHKVNIVPVVCDDFHTPSESQVEDIDKVYTDEQTNRLLTCGITGDMIKDAIRHLLKLKSVAMPRFGDMKQQEQCVFDILTQCKLPTNRINHEEGPLCQDTCRVLIVGKSSDPEAISICRTVQILLKQMTREEVKVVYSADDVKNLDSYTEYLIVILTRGVLVDPAFAETLLAFTEINECFEIIPVNADTGFEYPTTEFFTELAANGLGKPGLGPAEGHSLVEAYELLTSVLAKPLTPYGSESLIQRQVHTICLCFAAMDWTRMASMTPRSIFKVLPFLRYLMTAKLKESVYQKSDTRRTGRSMRGVAKGSTRSVAKASTLTEHNSSATTVDEEMDDNDTGTVLDEESSQRCEIQRPPATSAALSTVMSF